VRASFNCAVVAPGSPAVVKALVSCVSRVASNPKVMVGTTTPSVTRQKLIWSKPPPKLMVWLPLT
jgi:hypothetical protein